MKPFDPEKAKLRRELIKELGDQFFIPSRDVHDPEDGLCALLDKAVMAGLDDPKIDVLLGAQKPNIREQIRSGEIQPEWKWQLQTVAKIYDELRLMESAEQMA